MNGASEYFGRHIVWTLRFLAAAAPVLYALGKIPPDRQVMSIWVMAACIGLAELILIRRALESQ